MKSAPNIYQTSFFTALSVSYEKADAETRGRFSFFESHIKDFVQKITEKDIGDAFVVSTCNRTEIYTTTTNYLLVAEEYCSTIGVSLSDFMNYVKIYSREEAIEHLFRVAAGLESQIIGDFEIISQIKKAYARFKREKKNSNPFLERIINSAIQVSKKIKTETCISSGTTSVSYAAVQYILNHHLAREQKNILLLGTGDIGLITIDNLIKHLQDPKIKISNRNEEKSLKTAKKYGLDTVPYADFPKEITENDIVIVTTAAKEPIVKKSHFLRSNEKREILILDLSIPPNVEKEVNELPNVSLIGIDVLSEATSQTLEERKKDIPKAEMIIKKITKEFLDWEKKRKMAPKIHHFKSMLKKIEHNEMHSIHKKHRYIKIADMELTEKLVQKITNRFAKYIIENPLRSDEVSKLMKDMLVEPSNKKCHEKN
ncbi:MAG: glutamyl-tRNA reductase [Bergeyella sp.]|nr:glutamyl-tRNA reductase [Bergeyella sp.]